DVQRFVVQLPFHLHDVLEQWRQVRSAMIKSRPELFPRDEWAYLINFVSPSNLSRVFEQSFGKVVETRPSDLHALFRPRGGVAVWLPENVSLLGPLTLILASLTGNRLRLKSSSRTDDLTAVLLEFLRSSLTVGALKTYLQEQVELAQFDRQDLRNHAM